jgi:sugar lactone lactonase YvrE
MRNSKLGMRNARESLINQCHPEATCTEPVESVEWGQGETMSNEKLGMRNVKMRMKKFLLPYAFLITNCALILFLVHCDLKVKTNNAPLMKMFSLFQSNGGNNTVATPTFYPPTGTFNTSQIAIVSTTTSGASIYYTLDGSVPTINSILYTTAFSIVGDGTKKAIQAVAIKSGMKDSIVASGIYTIDQNAVSMPTFNPPEGTYNSDQSITLESKTAGATIYYTLDDTTPTTSSTKYITPISISGDGTKKTIQAIAVKSGLTNSSIGTSSFSIDRNSGSMPAFLPLPGTYKTDQSIVLSTNTVGAVIYYTEDGTIPTANSTKYSAAIPVGGNGTTKLIKAIAIKEGIKDSSVASGFFVIDYNAILAYYPPPTITSFNPNFGNSSSTVTINGTNFETPASNNIVCFSTSSNASISCPSANQALATVVSGTSTSLVVTVPVGTITGAISIKNQGGSVTSSNSFTGGVYVTTLAGAGSSGYADGTGTVAKFYSPYGVTVDSLGYIYVTGVATTLAGSCFVGDTVDGIGTSATFHALKGATIDLSGSIYVSDGGLYACGCCACSYKNYKIRAISSQGIVSTLAGTGSDGSTDGNPGTFSSPSGVAVDTYGYVYVADSNNNKIRKVSPNGNITTFAGSATNNSGSMDGTGTTASFNAPRGVAVDTAGNVYVADSGNHRIRKITTDRVVTTLAGSTSGFAEGTGTTAKFNSPYGIAVDSKGNMFVADTSNNRIRKVTTSGVVTTLAGSGVAGSADDLGAYASFNTPYGIAVDSVGLVYVADTGNHKIRKIFP